MLRPFRSVQLDRFDKINKICIIEWEIIILTLPKRMIPLTNQLDMGAVPIGGLCTDLFPNRTTEMVADIHTAFCQRRHCSLECQRQTKANHIASMACS